MTFQAYVACVLGVGFVSYATLVFGGVAAITSLAVGFSVKKIGRVTVFVIGKGIVSLYGSG